MSRQDGAWLRALLIAGPVVALAFAVVGLATGATDSAGEAIAAVGLPAVIVALLALGTRDRYACYAAAVLLDIEALLAGALLPTGIALAALMPIIGVLVSQPTLSSPIVRRVSYVAGVAAATGAALAVLVGPAHVVFQDAAAPLTIGAFTALVVFVLALGWRTTSHLRAAVEASKAELAARARAEQDLARTSQLLTAIVESSPLATQAFRPDRSVMVWNSASERIFGWTSDEIVGHSLPDGMIPEDDREPSAERIRRTLAGEPIQGDRVRRLTKDGRELWIEIYASALRAPDGTPIGIAGQLADVTDRVALDAKLAHAQRLEAIGRLAGGIAHDFNNTLTAIGGFASLIGQETGDTEAVREDAQTIVDVVERARQLTRQLLAFARRTTLQPVVVDVASTLAGFEPMLRRLVDPAVSVVVDAPEDSLTLRVDPGQLEQALVNLAVNARDAMAAGGRLTVSAHRVRVARGDLPEDPTIAGRFVAIAVSDTGTGIAPDVLAHVLEPFFTTKEAGHGTGLGLAMVSDFVRQSGGHVHIDSRLGAGTTVELRLPELTGRGARPRPEAATQALPGGTETVLLVELDADVAAFTRRQLGDLGYDVLSATGPDAAIDLADHHHGPIDLLVADLTGGRGTDIAQALASTRPALACLYTCGSSATTLADQGVAAEGLDLLPKPYDARELAVRVRRALDAQATGAPPTSRDASRPARSPGRSGSMPGYTPPLTNPGAPAG